MSGQRPDWSVHEAPVVEDQVTGYDTQRRSRRVGFSEELGWSVFHHADAASVLADPATFSNDVSQHLSVPNGMDPPTHTRFRGVVDPYFAPERIERFGPAYESMAETLVAALPEGEIEIMGALGHPFAARAQCLFMGWPDRLHDQLHEWTAHNQAATRRRDRTRLAELAAEFDGIITAQLDERRNVEGLASDTTAELLTAHVAGRRLTDDELVSIIRNWTAGELGTIAASVGILIHHLAQAPDLQADLRADPRRLSEVIHELLRMDGPLVASRRRTTRPVRLDGRRVEAGERITILWPSVNRDEAVFGDDEFDPDGHADDNLLYGAGIHACPGESLARLELKILIGTLLAATSDITPAGPAVRASYPVGGYTDVPVSISKTGPLDRMPADRT